MFNILFKLFYLVLDSAWYQFTQWLEYYGKIWNKVVVAVNPNFTSQDCSNCGYRVKKSLSTRTHTCPRCHTEICRDTNAAINILRKGLEIVGIEWKKGTVDAERRVEGRAFRNLREIGNAWGDKNLC